MALYVPMPPCPSPSSSKSFLESITARAQAPLTRHLPVASPNSSARLAECVRTAAAAVGSQVTSTHQKSTSAASIARTEGTLPRRSSVRLFLRNPVPRAAGGTIRWHVRVLLKLFPPAVQATTPLLPGTPAGCTVVIAGEDVRVATSQPRQPLCLGRSAHVHTCGR